MEDKAIGYKIILFTTVHEDVTVNGYVKDNFIWLTQKAMASLFGVEVPTVNRQLKEAYADGELAKGNITSEVELIHMEGERVIKLSIKIYKLEVAVALGYRIRSPKAVQFRMWLTKKLNQNLTQGLLSEDATNGGNYFIEVL